jgi:NAD-dependent SIR2 family protein deacetylase
MLNSHRDDNICLIHSQTFLLSFCKDEITEMKRKLKIMTHQVDQLKEEISAKESALVKLHLEQQRIEKEKETLKVQALQ